LSFLRDTNTKTHHLQSNKNNHSTDIDPEDYKETIGETSTANSNNDQALVSPLNNAGDSTRSDNVQTNAASTDHRKKSSTKTNSKSHKDAVQDHSLNEDNDRNSKQRSLSSSSSSSSSSTSSDNQTSNIPYETLNNEDDDDDDQPEHTEKQS